jgi:hypothetical protein
MSDINSVDKEDAPLLRYVYFYMVFWIYNNNNFYRVGGIRPENKNNKIVDNN